MLVHDPTGQYIPSMFAVMVYTEVTHGSAGVKVKVLVDSGIEHPPLMSQSMADKLRFAGPISGEVAQGDGTFLPLRDDCGIIRSLWTTHTLYSDSGITGRCYP